MFLSTEYPFATQRRLRHYRRSLDGGSFILTRTSPHRSKVESGLEGYHEVALPYLYERVDHTKLVYFLFATWKGEERFDPHQVRYEYTSRQASH